MLRVLIAEEQVILRESLKFMIEKDNEVEVIGCTGHYLDVLRLCEELLPDVILMNVTLPGMDVHNIGFIKQKSKDVKVLVLAMSDHNERVMHVIESGADGYILQDIKPDELILAVKSVAMGFRVIQQNTYHSLIKNFSKTCSPDTDIKAVGSFGLNERELIVLNLISNGKSNEQISEYLDLSQGSVKNIITAMQKKLGLKDRVQLIVFALKNELI